MTEDSKLKSEEENEKETESEEDMGDAQGEYKLQFNLHEVKRENTRLCQELESMKKDNTAYKVRQYSNDHSLSNPGYANILHNEITI